MSSWRLPSWPSQQLTRPPVTRRRSNCTTPASPMSNRPEAAAAARSKKIVTASKMKRGSGAPMHFAFGSRLVRCAEAGTAAGGAHSAAATFDRSATEGGIWRARGLTRKCISYRPECLRCPGEESQAKKVGQGWTLTYSRDLPAVTSSRFKTSWREPHRVKSYFGNRRRPPAALGFWFLDLH
jgi:hypothetical protein